MRAMPPPGRTTARPATLPLVTSPPFTSPAPQSGQGVRSTASSQGLASHAAAASARSRTAHFMAACYASTDGKCAAKPRIRSAQVLAISPWRYCRESPVLHLVHGNRFEELAAALADDLTASRQRGAIDLYTPAVVAVPGALIAGGLRLALARRLGIAATLRCPSLDQRFAEGVARARPDWLVLDRRMVQSLLVALLADEERLAGDELAPVRRYASSGAAREVRRVQLAGELARLFR